MGLRRCIACKHNNRVFSEIRPGRWMEKGIYARLCFSCAKVAGQVYRASHERKLGIAQALLRAGLTMPYHLQNVLKEEAWRQDGMQSLFSDRDTGQEEGLKTMAEVDLDQLEDTILGLSVVDASLLRKRLEKAMGVTGQTTIVSVPDHADAEAVSDDANDEFNVILTACGPNKIMAIKAVRETTNLDLRAAKDLVDGPPRTLKENISKAEADLLVKKFTEIGATVELV